MLKLLFSHHLIKFIVVYHRCGTGEICCPLQNWLVAAIFGTFLNNSDIIWLCRKLRLTAGLLQRLEKAADVWHPVGNGIMVRKSLFANHCAIRGLLKQLSLSHSLARGRLGMFLEVPWWRSCLDQNPGFPHFRSSVLGPDESDKNENMFLSTLHYRPALRVFSGDLMSECASSVNLNARAAWAYCFGQARRVGNDLLLSWLH